MWTVHLLQQQLLELAKVRGHSATDQVKVKDNKHQVGSDSQVVTILDWMVPDICSRCVARRLDLQAIHEDRSGIFISSKMGQSSVYLEAASEINDRKILHKSAKIMDEAIEWLWAQNDKDGLGAMKVRRGKYHKYLVQLLTTQTRVSAVWQCATI